jgi:hypothetical protein
VENNEESASGKWYSQSDSSNQQLNSQKSKKAEPIQPPLQSLETPREDAITTQCHEQAMRKT